MHFKYFQLSHKNNDVVVNAYPGEMDYTHIETNKMNDELAGAIMRKLIEVLTTIVSKIEFAHPFNYGQAIFAYPLFGQKLETVTGWVSGGKDTPMDAIAKKVAAILLNKFNKEFENEYKYISHENYLRYTETYQVAMEKAFMEGQIFVYLCTSPTGIEETPFDPDFVEDRVCIKYTEDGPVLLHKKEEDIRQKRNKFISEIRAKLTDGSYSEL